MKKRIVSILLVLILTVSNLVAYSHSGRTDSSGGHKDNKNVSGLGSYHYHHGYGPHLHPNGVCPYKSKTTTTSTTTESSKTATNKKIQQKLNDLGYDCGEVDGSIGPKTKAAIKAFQEDNGLTVDGSAGPQTKKVLGI